MTTEGKKAYLRYLRQWAKENGFDINVKGAIPRRVKDAYVRSRETDNTPIATILHTTDTTVDIVCPHCAEAHEHSRGRNTRAPHCSDGKPRRHYMIEDNRF